MVVPQHARECWLYAAFFLVAATAQAALDPGPSDRRLAVVVLLVWLLVQRARRITTNALLVAGAAEWALRSVTIIR